MEGRVAADAVNGNLHISDHAAGSVDGEEEIESGAVAVYEISVEISAFDSLLRALRKEHVLPDAAGHRSRHYVPAVHGRGFSQRERGKIIAECSAGGGKLIPSCIDHRREDVNDKGVASGLQPDSRERLRHQHIFAVTDLFTVQIHVRNRVNPLEIKVPVG